MFNDRVTDLTVSAYKTLAVFESRDNQSIQVSANLPDGAVKVQKFCHPHYFLLRVSTLTRNIDIAILSVRLSVRP